MATIDHLGILKGAAQANGHGPCSCILLRLFLFARADAVLIEVVFSIPVNGAVDLSIQVKLDGRCRSESYSCDGDDTFEHF